ncbi:MAG: hypothetical protein Q8K85_14040 [Hyphomicrobium sp.]|nr:hypothetical protein [Hyphomicrobium sp.]
MLVAFAEPTYTCVIGSSAFSGPRGFMQKVAVTCVLALFALLTSYAIVLAWPDGQAVAAHTASHDTLTR